jgi:hypothetical protein
MKCRNCEREIQDDVRFCPHCGKQNESSIAEVDIIKAHTWHPVEKNKTNMVTNALVCGSISVAVSFFLGSFFPIIGIVLGFIAVYYGLKTIKSPSVKKAVLGTTLGFLGIVFGGIYLATVGIQTRTINNLNEKYQEKFNLVLPDKSPDSYVINNNLVPRYSFHVNEFHYTLSEQEMEKFLFSEVPWENLPLNHQLSSKFIELEFNAHSGFYFCYDNELESYILPNLNKEYDIVIIVLDTNKGKLSIYEIWV